MPAALLISALVVAVAAAVRSTWSPCGWSMLSTITPLTERSRGHRFGATAAWFVVGATLGGLALGTLGALSALLVRLVDLSPATRLVVAGIAVATAVAFDTGLLGPALPHHRRQVNERWLDEFRPWVYASGFGAQIGAGLATYIMTASVYLVVVLGAVTAAPWSGLLLGATFGATRGAAVLAGRNSVSPETLTRFHQRFAAWAEPSRRAVIAVDSVVAVGLLATGATGPAIGAGAALLAVAASAIALHLSRVSPVRSSRRPALD
ncbi:MAG: hypothetical protein U0Q22_00710 [Acidimicrobiales bacterium]